jgi:hypothetical protein
MLVKFAGRTEVQVSENGQISLLSNPYVPPLLEEKAATASGNNNASLPELAGENYSLLEQLLGNFVEPKLDKIADKQPPSYRAPISGNRIYELRDTMPTQFKTERIPLMVGLAESIIAKIRLDDALLLAGLRRNKEIVRQTIDIFNQADKLIENIQAKLSVTEIAQRAQQVLFDSGFIHPEDLKEALLLRLKSEYIRYGGINLSDSELLSCLNMLLFIYPKLIHNAAKSYLAEYKEVLLTDELPKQIEASESIERASLNSYGIIPTDLNETERLFARLLETDTSKTVQWWHRNKDRKSHSVGIVLPNGSRYFPDFIIGINNRSKGEGMLLIEIKGGHILNSEDTQEKITAEHKIYGIPLMLTLQDDGQFWIMLLNESASKIEKDKPFRVENMGQY